MAQYNITATSAKREMTVSGTNTKKFPTPAEFDTQELAQANADKYAKRLNHKITKVFVIGLDKLQQSKIWINPE
jgi:hypothetical protein